MSFDIWPVATGITTGILSSLAALALVYSYSQVRSRWHERHLRGVLGAVGNQCGVVFPPNPGVVASGGPPTTSIPATFAISHILAACERMDLDSTLLSTTRLPDDIPADLIVLGGHRANSLTEAYLENFCSGFKIRDVPEEGGSNRTTYYECGGRKFVDDNTLAHAFIVRLLARDTGLAGNVTLCWGHSAVGTAASAFFASNHSRTLSHLRGKSFFITFEIDKRLGYRMFAPTYLELSEHALQFSADSDEPAG